MKELKEFLEVVIELEKHNGSEPLANKFKEILADVEKGDPKEVAARFWTE